MASDRQEEYDRVQQEAEEFLAPLYPLLAAWQKTLKPGGIILTHQLLVGPYPVNAPENPVKAGLMVSVKGKGIPSGGSLYAVENYQPDALDWLAATIDYAIETRLDSPDFGLLPDSIFEMEFKLVALDREGDHDHCACCCTTISPEYPLHAYLSENRNTQFEVWLCPRCFDYWAASRGLTVSE